MDPKGFNLAPSRFGTGLCPLILIFEYKILIG